MNYLVIVDMQEDFHPDAALVEDIRRKIRWLRPDPGYQVCWTQDWHSSKDFFSMKESELYGVHCLENSPGAKIVKDLWKEYHRNDILIQKNGFMPLDLPQEIREPQVIQICGVCTHICVLNTALLLRAKFPESEIWVDLYCCGGSSKKETEATRLILEANAIEVEGWKIEGEI